MVYAPIPQEIERVAKTVVDACFKVHEPLGPGLLESAYEHCLARLGFLMNFNVELFKHGIKRLVC
jgi:PD-(D/E)XK nuclease superfamily